MEEATKEELSIFYKDGVWYRGEKLGEGGFGTVHLALFPSPHPCYYYRDFPPVAAVKSACFGMSNSLRWEKEVYNALQGCPFVVNFLGDDVTMTDNIHDDFDRKMIVNLFLEYAAGGTLQDLMNRSENLRLLEPQARRFTRSILGGIERIHREGFVHCDLKLENVLLVYEGEELVAKVADLGLAKRVEASEETCPRGTVDYWAPEVVIDRVQGQASDIWALGCVVFGMLTGELPWDSRRCSTSSELERAIAAYSPSLPCGEFSDAADSFMNMCFRIDRRKRPTAAELLRHPFVAGDDEEKIGMIGHVAQSSWRIVQEHHHQVIVIDD